jgi:hypothetical protein
MYSAGISLGDVGYPIARMRHVPTARPILPPGPYKPNKLIQAKLKALARADCVVVVPYVADPNPSEPPANASDLALYTRYIPIG